MKMVFMSNSGESLPIVWRLRRESVDAKIYIHSPQYKKNYNGIFDKIKTTNVKKEIKDADIVIFDITRPNERKKHDIILLRMFGIKTSSKTVFGPIADKIGKDRLVIGASTVADELELDRNRGVELARDMGYSIPETHPFDNLTEGIAFLKGSKDLWVFKPNDNQDLDMTYVEKFKGELVSKMLEEYNRRVGEKLSYILQKKIDGVEVSTEVWIGKHGPVLFNHTLESKRLMDANLGPAIGSQSNTVWINSDNKGFLTAPLARMATYLKDSGYIGPCDANCIVSGNKAYFLEWTPRFGYDAIFCLFTLMKTKLSDFFANDFKAEYYDGYGASQRISIPPYPYAAGTLLRDYARDVSIHNKLDKSPFLWAQDVYSDAGELKCAGADGILGIVTGRGRSPDEAHGRVYNAIGKLRVCSYLQYRTDGLKEAQSRLKELKIA